MFFVGSLGASLSPDLISLVVFRAFTGIWGGGLISLGQMVIGDSVSLRDRGKYQGILGSFMVLGNGLGPVLGGVLAQKASWRDQYRIMLPLSALAAAVAWRCLPLKKVKGNWKHKAAAVDWVGAVLTLVATTLIVLGLSWAGGSYAWSDAHVLAPLIIGLFFTLLFALWQWKGCSDARPPLLPLYIFQNRIVCGAAITQCINGWLLYVQMFFIPQCYQLVFGHSPIVAGALLLPLLCVQSLSSTLSGLVVSKTGRYREVLLSGWALWAVGLGLFSTLTERSGWGKQIGFACLTGSGVGQTLQVGLVALQGAVPRREMAVVTAMRNFVRNLGAAVGLAAGSTLVNTLTLGALRPLGWTTAQVRAALDNPSDTGLSRARLEQLRAAYSRGFRANFVLLAALAAVAFLATLVLMSHRGIDRDDDAALKAEGKRQVREDRERREAKAEAKRRWGRAGGGQGEGGDGTEEEAGGGCETGRQRPPDVAPSEGQVTAVR